MAKTANGPAAPTIVRLTSTDVLLGVRAKGGKPTILQMLAAEASARLGRPAETILDALVAREALGTTALGRGVALPHARLPGEHPPLLLLTRLARATDWESRDDEDVDIVLLVLWPEAAADSFLPTLAEICRALREPRTLRDLRAATTPAEMAAALVPATGGIVTATPPPGGAET